MTPRRESEEPSEEEDTCRTVPDPWTPSPEPRKEDRERKGKRRREERGRKEKRGEEKRTRREGERRERKEWR